MQHMMLLAGDIGGTKTDLCVFRFGTSSSRTLDIHDKATFLNRDIETLDSLIQAYVAQKNVSFERAAFAVAGPVSGGRAVMTNLPWTVSKAQLEASLGISTVHLVNDLEALALAVPHLTPEDLLVLHEGKRARGNIGVIAPGTGLGESYLAPIGDGFTAQATEGGHADFAPRSALEMRLLEYLVERYSHVSYERVCSGMAIADLYRFLNRVEGIPEPPALAGRLSALPDPTAAIVSEALLAGDPTNLCSRAIELFAAILGAESGNLALKTMAVGGVYLGGGIPRRITGILTQGPFMASFLDKGRMSKLLSDIPVHVILNPKATLYGAACKALAP